MLLTAMHREDVKAALRKRHGSLHAFEQARGLPKDSVSDLLRGKASQRVAQAIELEFNDEDLLPDPEPVSDASDDSASNGTAHRLNAAVR